MAQTPIIISFANLKGGVGKSAMCSLFGCYLHTQCSKVVVLDGDMQGSIYKKRAQCINEGHISADDDGRKSFKLFRVDLTAKESVVAKLRSVITDDKPDVILIDTPGGMNDLSFINLMSLSHYVVTPFNYEEANVIATLHFVKKFFAINKVAENEPSKQDGRLILIPNRIVSTWGTNEERELWARTLAILNTIAGCVTHPVNALKAVSAWDTLALYPRQWSAVGKAFENIYFQLFKSDPPITMYQDT